MLTLQMQELLADKAKCEVGGNQFSFSNLWDRRQCEEAVQSTHFNQVEFIDCHQVVWTSHASHEESEFHNNGLPPEDFLSPLFYLPNLDYPIKGGVS